MIEMFGERIVEAGRLPLFGFFAAFIITFVVTRVNVRLIRSNVRWLRNVTAGDVHIHHVVFGVVLMLVGGVGSVAIPDAHVRFELAAAVVFGVGSALVLDEFALILHLSDVYWTEKGRASVDAVFVAIAVTGLLLLGIHPFGYENLWFDSGSGSGSLSPLYAAFLFGNLVLAVITLLKGKIWTGLIGLFLPALLIVGAIRVARPASPWSRWRYDADSRRYQRAVRREKKLRRPLIRGKIWVQEFIAGRHDLIPPELMQRRAEATERARLRRVARARRRAAARAARAARKATPGTPRGPVTGGEGRTETRARRGALARTHRGTASRMRTRAATRRRARHTEPEEEPPPSERPRAGTSG
ncbi:hypothetical protein [Actinomadura sp. 6K520]|uniref:hypothetical protein n=1 Tax=Actinomadura sp. 6K520 TaxID=2530364 RepID=UPI002440F586|nr:hypothetical protein [Actinomadura sp. 6K520]